MTISKEACVLSVCLAIMLSCPFAVTADAASNRPYWTYDMSLMFEEPHVEKIYLSGEATYVREKDSRISVHGHSYNVAVFNYHSEASASGVHNGSAYTISYAESALDYSDLATGGTLMQDSNTWENFTFGTGSSQITSNHTYQYISDYSPPLFAGYTSDKGPGDSWNESVDVTMTTYVDGALYEGPYTQTISFHFEIAENTEQIVTEAGTFESIKLTLTDDQGGTMISWDAPEVGSSVKIEYYDSGQSDPWLTYDLTSYSLGGAEEPPSLIGGLVVAAIAAAIIVFVVFMLWRKSKRAATTQAVWPPQPGAPSAQPQPWQPMPAEAIRFCPYCGQQVAPGDVACRWCGRRVG